MGKQQRALGYSGRTFQILLGCLLFFTLILPGCGGISGLPDTAPVFQYSPLALEEINYIVPLGNFNPPGHALPTDHEYFYYDSSQTHDLFAPGDGVLYQVQRKTYIPDPSTGIQYTDDGLFIQYGGKVHLILGHVATLSQEISGVLGEIKEGMTKCNIKIKAGQLLGKVGGEGMPVTALDFWCVNTSIKPSYVRPERYPDDSKYAVDGLQYYAEPLKSELYGKIQRTAEPLCGQYDYDIEGKLAGNWFRDGVPVDEWQGADCLSFAYNNLDPSKIFICLGGTLPLSPAVYFVKGNTPDPASVSQATGLVKYELVTSSADDAKFEASIADLPPDIQAQKRADLANAENKVVAVMLVRIVGKDKIEVEVFTGKTAQDVSDFDASATYYIR